jgi:FixJ family two-component response regulator
MVQVTRSDRIITDVAMQGMKRPQLALVLKSRGGKVLAIMITALPDKNLERQATCHGALRLLRKRSSRMH